MTRAIFVGDSITQSGRWQEWLPELEAFNFGVNGNMTGDLLGRLPAALQARPDIVVVLIGTNDLSTHQRPIQSMLDYMEAILGMIRLQAPAARVIVESVLPRRIEFADRVREYNAGQQELASRYGAEYLDLWPIFATPDGDLRREYTDENQVHLNGGGYEAWLAVLRRALSGTV